MVIFQILPAKVILAKMFEVIEHEVHFHVVLFGNYLDVYKLLAYKLSPVIDVELPNVS